MEKEERKNALSPTETTGEKSLLSQLREMETGDKICFPINRMSYVRSISVSFGAEWGRKYKTRLLKDSKQIQVTRLY